MHLVRGATVIVITSSPDKNRAIASRHLEQRGLRVIAVLIAPDSFGGEWGMEEVTAELAASGAPTYIVKEGDDLAEALSQKARGVIEQPRYILRK